MKTLAIESSCDDTSLALVDWTEGGFVVEKMVTRRQTVHNDYGGVVPELAARSHAERIIEVIEEMQVDPAEIDCISVTKLPGLPGPLVVGVTAAYTLGALWDKPVIDVHHIMGHVFSILLDRSLDLLQLPYLVLTVSGGHNDIYLVTQSDPHLTTTDHADLRHKRGHLAIDDALAVGPYHVTKLAQTMDDAAGEVFDKVARMLGGPYPGGPWIGQQALWADPELVKQIDLSLPWWDDPAQFSFSWLKSKVHNRIERHGSLDESRTQALASAFQERIVQALIERVERYAQHHAVRTIGIVGGVAANNRLAERAAQELWAYDLYFPAQKVYCTDNAAMIALPGLFSFADS